MDARHSKAFAEGFMGVCFSEGVMEKPACALLLRAMTEGDSCRTEEGRELLKLATRLKELREKNSTQPA